MNKKIIALLGENILSSLSPYLFKSMVKDEEYHYTLMSGLDLKLCMDCFKEHKNFLALNITSPYKEKVLNFIDQQNKEVKDIKAANTIIKNKDNRLSAFNFDIKGVTESLSEYSVRDKNIVVLGAGGAALSVVYACKMNGGKVSILNRNIKRVENIANKFNCNIISHNNKKIVFDNADIIISTLPSNQSLISKNYFSKGQIFFDAVYKEETALQKMAKERECTILDGYSWLENQGRYSYEKILNKKINNNKNNLELVKNKKRHIAIIGFTGTGKSFLLNRLSCRIGRKALDTDLLIEEKIGLKIEDIFKNKGEIFFRNIETEVLNNLLDSDEPLIISTGGGVINQNRNIELLRKKSFNIMLYSPFEEIYKTGELFKRPVFKSRSFDFIKDTFNKRFPKYAYTSDFIYVFKDINKIDDKIMHELKEGKIL